MRINERIMDIVPYRPSKAAVDVNLAGNEGLRPPNDLLAGWDTDLLQRYPSTRELEVQLAERFGVSPDWVLVTAGADDALDRFCRAFLAPGREMVLPVPTFEMLPRYVKLCGATTRDVAWPDGDFPCDAVLRAVNKATGAIALVSPNNPTGAVATSDDLATVCRGFDGAVLVDLAYAEFADEDLTTAALQYDNAIVVRTLSKAWGLAGLRIGFALGRPALLDALRRVGQPYAASGLSLAVASRWLREGAAAVEGFVQRVRDERGLLRDELTSLGVTSLPSQANFILAETDAAWMTDGLAALGIGVRRWTCPERSRYVRITCPGDEAIFERLRRTLRTICRPQALLFDMDGVLADVRESYREAIIRTAASFEVTVTQEDIAAAKAAGNANNDWELTQRLLAERGRDVDLQRVTERFEELYQGRSAEGGSRDALHERETLRCEAGWLRAMATRLPLGIVTGRPRRDAQRFLERFGLSELFGAVVCMEDAPAKPDPAPVREALRQLGVERGWLLGDTPDDIRAARAAGVLPIGILAPGESGAPLRNAGATRVFAQVEQLAEVLP